MFGVAGFIAGLGLTIFVSFAASDQKHPQVTIQQGTLVGKYIESEYKKRDIAAFLGVPYGSPPIGDRRFKKAEPAGPWLGVLNATSVGPECLQYDHFNQFTTFEVHGSEDCLYLDVYSPKLPDESSDAKLLDVVFYIHGGAFTFLSGSPFGSEFLLDKDIVYVTINYRLGILGFLSTQDEVVPGNNGLKDQLLALKWVKKNIAKFGGNPNKITLAGTSAGGASVHYHVLSPQSKGLFQRGIIMSGSVLNPWPQTEKPLAKAQRVSAEMGCPTSNTLQMIECLRRRPGPQIVGKTKLFMPWLYNPFTPFGPTVEPSHSDSFIEENPIDIILSQKASDVPLLFSYTADEGLYPGSQIIGNDKLVRELEENWDAFLPHLLDYNFTIPENRRAELSKKIRTFYVKGDDFIRGIIQMIGDRLFVVGIKQAAKLHAKLYKSPSYAYVFTFKGSRRGFMKTDIYDGVSHADDLAYLTKKVIPWGSIGSDDRSQQMVHYLVNLWSSFVEGKMETDGWPQLKTSLPAFGYLNVTSGNAEDNDFEVDANTEIEDFWNGLNFVENPVTYNSHAEL